MGDAKDLLNTSLDDLRLKLEPKFDLMKLTYSHIRPTFDVYQMVDKFPNVQNSNYEKMLKDAIEIRLKTIKPLRSDMNLLMQDVSNFMMILSRMKDNPSLDACIITEILIVGSLRIGTLIQGEKTAEIAIILKTLPIRAAISSFGHKILDEIQCYDTSKQYRMSFYDGTIEFVNIKTQNKIRLLITTITKNINKLKNEIHIARRHVEFNSREIYHAKWISSNIIDDDIKNLIRLMKDMVARFEEFSFFTPWMIVVLSHHAITSTPSRTSLPLHVGFQRIFQNLSSGIFLPYSKGITDPFEPKMPIHGRLTVFDQETITLKAQHLLRILNAQNGPNYVLGLTSLSESIQFDPELAKIIQKKPVPILSKPTDFVIKPRSEI
ncbi:ABC transporter G family member 20-like [Sarcoptes scabiei]|nr:ABC transporter G family member 20-like [Sarcoptes scabiei]